MHLSIWVDFDSNPWSELLCQNSHSAYLLESRTNLMYVQDEVHAAGRTLTGLYDAVAQYCGAPFGEQRPETWAFPYFDLVRTPLIGPPFMRLAPCFPDAILL